jgi:arylsulfatase A-like enzyme
MRAPNILIMMTDQQRGDTVLPEHPCRTPNLDRFRTQATTFARTYCPSPHCCPARATFFSGLYPSEHGVWNNVAVTNALSTDLSPGVRLWSQDLAAAGYCCDFFGKWHVSYERGPRDFGWTEAIVHAGPRKDGVGFMGPTWDSYAAMDCATPATPRMRGEIRRPGWGDQRLYGELDDGPDSDGTLVEHACQRLRARARSVEPWCMYVGTFGPHDPYFVPRRFLDLYRDVDVPLPASFSDRMLDKPALYRRTRGFFDQLTPDEHREAIRHYWALCTYEDHLFGQLLEALEQSGQADRTIVIYCADHGDYAAEHGLWCKGLPCFGSAYHVPLIVRLPGSGGAGRRVEALATLADVAPTLREAVGVGRTEPTSGCSLLPWLNGGTPAQWRDAVHTQTNGNEQLGVQRSITTTDGWKYVYNGFDFDELYDLKADPHEMVNLATRPEHRPRLEALCARMWAFARRHNDQAINNYIMVGMAPVGPAYGCH